jgi:hypothetical protein
MPLTRRYARLVCCFVGATWPWTCATSARADDVKASCVAAYDGGQRARLAGDLARARDELRTCSRQACPDLIRADCVRWLREVEDAIPTVILGARDASGNDLSDVRLLVDGELVQQRLTGKPIELSAGEHVFRFERNGSPPVERKLVINGGEKNRLVQVTMQVPRADAAPQSDLDRALPFVLGGLGLSLVTAGIVLDLVGTAELDELHERCEGLCSEAEVDATRTKILVGDTLLAVGIVSVGAAAVWLLLRDPAAPAAVAGNGAAAAGPHARWAGGL